MLLWARTPKVVLQMDGSRSMRLLLARSPPKKSTLTLQTGRQFNEASFQTGVPPRPRYKFTRRLGGEICHQNRLIAPAAITDEPPTGLVLD